MLQKGPTAARKNGKRLRRVGYRDRWPMMKGGQ